jgi:hypothetical protein
VSVDLSHASIAEVVEATRRMSADEVKEVMASPAREHVLDALIDHMVAGFRPDAEPDVEAIIHVKVWDRPDGGYDHFELVIHEGTCVASRPPSHEPALTLKAGPVDLQALLTGRTGPRRLAMRGKLRVVGDLGLGLKLPSMFTLGA